jgi:hypothetical protein
LYGISEVVLGVMCMVGLSKSVLTPAETQAQWTALIASSYVVARGLNNWQEGREKSKALNDSKGENG